MIGRVLYLLGLLLLIGVSNKSKAYDLDKTPKHKLESPINQGASKRIKFTPDTDTNAENQSIEKLGIVASPEFWNSDIRIVEKVLSYLNYPIPLLKGGLLRKASEQFNKVPVEIKIDDQVLRKPLDELSDGEFARISSFLNPGLTVRYGIYKMRKFRQSGTMKRSWQRCRIENLIIFRLSWNYWKQSLLKLKLKSGMKY